MRRYFRPFDAVSWGLAILATVVAVIAAGRPDNPLAGKIVAAMTAAVFWVPPVVVLLWRIAAQRADYTTRLGVRVRLGKKNRPDRHAVDKWEDELEAFWGTHLDNTAALENVLVDRVIVFVDVAKLSVLGRYVRGYNTGTHAAVGYRETGGKPDWLFVHRLFMHEAGHWGALAKTGTWDEAIHHTLFKALEYGY